MSLLTNLETIHIYPSFKSSKLELTNLTLNIHINIFLTEFDEGRVMMKIFYDLNDQFIAKKLND